MPHSPHGVHWHHEPNAGACAGLLPCCWFGGQRPLTIVHGLRWRGTAKGGPPLRKRDAQPRTGSGHRGSVVQHASQRRAGLPCVGAGSCLCRASGRMVAPEVKGAGSQRWIALLALALILTPPGDSRAQWLQAWRDVLQPHPARTPGTRRRISTWQQGGNAAAACSGMLPGPAMESIVPARLVARRVWAQRALKTSQASTTQWKA